MSNYTLFLVKDIFLSGKKNVGMPSLYMLLNTYEELGGKGAVFTTEKKSNINDSSLMDYFFFRPLVSIGERKVLKFVWGIIEYLYYNIIYFTFAFRLLRKVKGNKVVYTTIEFSLSAYLLSLFFKDLKTIVRFYGVFSSPYLGEKRRMLALYQEVLAFKLPADKYIITNDGTSGDSSAAYFKVPKEKVWFVVNGVSEHANNIDINSIREMYDVKENEFFLFCASRLVGWKRVDRIIRAVKNMPGIKLVIAGDGDMKEYYESISDPENTRFIGFINNDEVSSIMRSCDLFVSLYDLSNVGNPLLEALWCGQAILTYNSGRTSDFIIDGYNGSLVSSSNNEDQIVRDVINRITVLKNTPEKVRLLNLGAKEYAKNNLLPWKERLSLECQVIQSI
ncbi:glycosyltransferase family 4 protein [Aliamphritea spongicola]|uniref:glycosyltransferase family 4 protein n=1 Tax=Aliamphritea spongicola TaxID=707589 RepID=UPI00196B010E|nr:glycosyltransferase family 4 protein [Aliamphritea spongicola]MBN3563580.1 glycosyltransferase family 4 protein [Aliamphritea spongicola]